MKSNPAYFLEDNIKYTYLSARWPLASAQTLSVACRIRGAPGPAGPLTVSSQYAASSDS